MPTPMLVVFVGGAFDSASGTMRRLCASHVVFAGTKRYFAHDEDDRIIALIRARPDPRRHVVLVGHSWGGATVLNVARALPAVWFSIVVTLDPVSMFGAPSRKPPNVGTWINAFVDHSASGAGNFLASLGGAWGRHPAADENIDQGPHSSHANVQRLFFPAERRIHALRFSAPMRRSIR